VNKCNYGVDYMQSGQ